MKNNNLHTNKYHLFKGFEYQIKKPTRWQVVSTPKFDTLLVGPKIAGVHLNISIQISDSQSFRDVYQLSTYLQNIQKEKYTEYQLISSGNYLVSNQLGILQKCNWFSEHSQNIIFQNQLLITSTKKFYLLTTTQPKNEHFCNIESTFNEIMNSLTFTVH